MSKRFTKTGINFCLDVSLLCVFLLLCWCSVVIRYVFPPGGQAEGWTLWGGDYLLWTDVQFVTLCVFAMGILVHVMLHWSWVCGVIVNRLKRDKGSAAKIDDGTRTLWGVGLLIVILNVLGVGIAAAALTIQGPTP